MAYADGQPWDKTLSYTYGQTCTYNGYAYRWFVQSRGSTAGVKPNVETDSFIAAGDGSTDSRTERAWLLESQESVSSIFANVRGLPKGVSIANLILGYAQGRKVTPPQGVIPDQTGKLSWAFYGWIKGMSHDYDASQNYVGVYWPTKDNPFEVAVDRPNQDNVFVPTVQEAYPEDPAPSTVYLQSIFSMGQNNAVAEGGADTAAQLIWTGRTYEYTITVSFYKTVDGAEVLIGTDSKSNSITSPSIVDGWTLPEKITYGPVDSFAKPMDTEYYTFGYAITSIAPALDA